MNSLIKPRYSFFDVLFFGMCMVVGVVLAVMGYSMLQQDLIAISIFGLWIIPSTFIFKRNYKVKLRWEDE